MQLFSQNFIVLIQSNAYVVTYICITLAVLKTYILVTAIKFHKCFICVLTEVTLKTYYFHL